VREADKGDGTCFASCAAEVSMSEPREREDESRRPNEVPQDRPNERPEPEHDDPVGLPSTDDAPKPLSETVLDIDDAQLVDPAAEPGKPI
jgi:hypothetical protein